MQLNLRGLVFFTIAKVETAYADLGISRKNMIFGTPVIFVGAPPSYEWHILLIAVSIIFDRKLRVFVDRAQGTLISKSEAPLRLPVIMGKRNEVPSLR